MLGHELLTLGGQTGILCQTFRLLGAQLRRLGLLLGEECLLTLFVGQLRLLLGLNALFVGDGSLFAGYLLQLAAHAP